MGKTVALVLGSGGARGMAHIGVIEELEKRGYEIISISGCSMGSVVGAFYSAGKLDIFYEWAKTLNYLNLLRLVDFSFISNGAIRGDKVFAVLSDMLGDIQIEDLNIPFTAVATDLISSKEVWFQRGSLEQAIRASVAIPGLIQPVEHDSKLYVDGGVLNPLPIAASVSAHADYIIAVDLNADVPIPVIQKSKQAANNGQQESVDQELAEELEERKQAQAQNEAVEQLDKVDEEEGSKKLKLIKAESITDSVWLNNMVSKASGWFSQDSDSSEEESTVKAKAANSGSSLGKLGILYQMFEVMQASLSQYKIAGYPPDLLIKIPKNSGEMYEFHRTEEFVEMGRHIAKEALDAFEQGHSSLYGQR